MGKGNKHDKFSYILTNIPTGNLRVNICQSDKHVLTKNLYM